MTLEKYNFQIRLRRLVLDTQVLHGRRLVMDEPPKGE